MQHLKEDLFEKVSAVLESPDKRPNGQAALRAALTGRWQAALDKGARFWARHRDSSSAGQAELQAPLQDLHKDIHATIDAEVDSCESPHKSTICSLVDCIKALCVAFCTGTAVLCLQMRTFSFSLVKGIHENQLATGPF